MREVVVVSAVRTAIGTFGGSLKTFRPRSSRRSSCARRSARGRRPGAGRPRGVRHVINTEPRDMYCRGSPRSRAAVAGRAAMNVNRLCGSGLQAIVSAAQSVMLGDADVAIAAAPSR